MPFDDVLETQTIALSPKEKIEVIAKEITALEEIYKSLETTIPQGPRDAELLMTKIEQIYFAYQNVLNEINYDLLDKLRDAPNTKDFFTLFFKDMKPDTTEEKLIRYTVFKAKRAGELADTVVDIVPLLAKTIAITALLHSIYIRAVQKLANYIIKGKEIAIAQIENEPMKDIEKEWQMLGFRGNSFATRQAFLIKKKLKTKEEVIAGGLVNSNTLKEVSRRLEQRWEEVFGKNPTTISNNDDNNGAILGNNTDNVVGKKIAEEEEEGDIPVSTSGS